MKAKNKIRLWLRRIHRDAGYLVVGITLVYALSGIFLHHKMGVKTTIATIQMAPKLNPDQLKIEWLNQSNLPSINLIDERPQQIQFYFPGGMGHYQKGNGLAIFETYKDRPLVLFMSKLHENQVKGWSIVADIYAVILAFLALSGLFMVPGKNGFLRRGIWWFAAGILLVLAFALV
ncbi:PepSY-associated TM helix domain-containing protein [Geofilum rhodophaeum]|uniref:PepSY-associated TM helix domain-containing protein n=1 Tax=Geofilum rhodophaeum TaxID=1965019 RepID=UPI000B522796|nr:PepSY-associated TM helix domain-containing protein [Geofilum rhodophaeum]